MNYRKWTEEEDKKLIELWATKAPLKEIGRKIGRTVHAIDKRATSLNLTRRGGPREYLPWDDASVEMLRKLWAEGVSPGMIGEQLGRTKLAISTHANKIGLPARYSTQTGNSWFNMSEDGKRAVVSKSGTACFAPSKKALAAAKKHAERVFAPVDTSPEAMEARRAISRMNHAKAQRNWVQDMFRGCEIPKSTLKRLGL